MSAARLNVGTSGNASVRLAGGGFLVTPSGMAAEACGEDDLVEITATGEARGTRAPSSEWLLHRDIFAAFPAAGAVLHAHPPFATALACLRRDIPPFHYMIARFGGSTVRCSSYATFGTQALSDAAIAALQERCACLLGNHGMVVWGRDLDHALGVGGDDGVLGAVQDCALQRSVLAQRGLGAHALVHFGA
ncbi:class II aldolase, partial [Azoarcus sp. TTM-91]|uniref:class II aldolase/adducin family protein n=1 Tax=Azoarcus sp. TTM-91 TaxID=2691581 RepID=UPI0016A0B4F8